MDNDAGRYRRFLDGDDNSLEELIDIHNQGLTLYINKIVNNICEAEEIMQETFVKIAIKKPRFNGKCSFKTWLYSIARNCTYDFIRRSLRNAVSIDEGFELSDETDIEKNHLIEEDKIELHEAIKSMNPDYSQVIYLTFFEDFSIEDITRIMKKNKRQVSDLLYRAKQSLKSELEGRGFVYEKF